MTLAVGRSNFDLPELRGATLEFTGDLGEVTVDDAALVRVLADAVRKALGGARSSFAVRIEPRGDAGEIVVRITGRRSSLQLAFERDEAEPGYVSGIVRDAVERFGL